MTFEPFHCTFVGDTQGFKVDPEEGTLNRRGGEATVLDVSFKGNVSRVTRWHWREFWGLPRRCCLVHYDTTIVFNRYVCLWKIVVYVAVAPR